MPQVTFDFPPTVFSVVRKSTAEFAAEAGITNGRRAGKERPEGHPGKFAVRGLHQPPHACSDTQRPVPPSTRWSTSSTPTITAAWAIRRVNSATTRRNRGRQMRSREVQMLSDSTLPHVQRMLVMLGLAVLVAPCAAWARPWRQLGPEQAGATP